MWAMMQQPQPDDNVIATGESHSIREFLTEAFCAAGSDWTKYIEFDGRYVRPTEVECLRGDASKAKARLNWKPRVGFKQLVKMMVDQDLELASREKMLLDAGHHGTVRISMY
jgi:GDPmannose 4,6-dehydratase